jgi:ParB family chromosome partitioning protein
MTGTLQHLDPTTLLIGDNVRDDAALDKPFLASVREHDVLQPITAVPTARGHRSPRRAAPHPGRP